MQTLGRVYINKLKMSVSHKRHLVSDFGGNYPADAVFIDRKRGTFSIQANLPTRTTPSPGVPTVKREPKTLFPCIHRQNHVGDTPCGGCGGNKYVEVYACPKHTSCTVSRQAKDKRIKHCASCDDRATGGIVVQFADYNNKYDGKTAMIVGRGRTTFNDADLAKHDGPIIFVNDAVQLEKHCPDNNDTFFFAQDKRMLPVMQGLRSIAVIGKDNNLGFAVSHNAMPEIGKVMWTTTVLHGTSRLLELSRDQLAIERRLYRAQREVVGVKSNGDPLLGPSPTIVMALHFAWYIGCTNVKLVRCDGLAEGYSTDIENKSHSPVVNVHKYHQARMDADVVMSQLGMTREYVGTPDPLPETIDILMDFTGTETDAPGRAELNDRAWASFAANLRGVNMKASMLYLNIDHVPGGVGPGLTIEVARKYFGRVAVNSPDNPNFALAVKWAISQPTREYLFHLEADWILSSPVDVRDAVAVFNDDLALACVNIRAYAFGEEDSRICLSPGIWRTEIAKSIADNMTGDANPESQLRNASSMNPHGGKHGGFKGAQFPRDPSHKIVSDIGRPWIRATNYRRPVGTHFVTWLTTGAVK